jgi:hypothetical protein
MTDDLGGEAMTMVERETEVRISGLCRMNSLITSPAFNLTIPIRKAQVKRLDGRDAQGWIFKLASSRLQHND